MQVQEYIQGIEAMDPLRYFTFNVESNQEAYKSLPVQVADSNRREVDLGLVGQVDAGDDWELQVVRDDAHEAVDCQEGEEAKDGDPVEEPQFGSCSLRNKH